MLFKKNSGGGAFQLEKLQIFLAPFWFKMAHQFHIYKS